MMPTPPAVVRETHSAVVLLMGEYAYKFKKAVDLGFLDFRSDAARRDVCRRELELNRRLAPDVYLDVIAVKGSEGRSLEHGLLMRRMPEDRRLSNTGAARRGGGGGPPAHARAAACLLPCRRRAKPGNHGRSRPGRARAPVEGQPSRDREISRLNPQRIHAPSERICR